MDGSVSSRLVLKNINKYYPNPRAKQAVHALADVNLEFTEGIYGITGKNGAGKSTLMQILTGFLQVDSGEILWNGSKISTRSAAYKKLLGYMPQQQMLYESMSCLQFMNYMSALKEVDGKRRRESVEELLQKVHLWEKRKVKIHSLSGGMKQRLLFAQACLGSPELLLLDEPTAGVDPDERENLQRIVKENSEGKIVILSTHILSDIETIAKKEIRLEGGRVVREYADANM